MTVAAPIRRGTELGLQIALAGDRLPGARVGARRRQGGGSGRGSVLVGTEDVGGRAGVADRGRRFEVAEGKRAAPIRVEALDDVLTVA